MTTKAELVEGDKQRRKQEKLERKFQSYLDEFTCYDPEPAQAVVDDSKYHINDIIDGMRERGYTATGIAMSDAFFSDRRTKVLFTKQKEER